MEFRIKNVELILNSNSFATKSLYKPNFPPHNILGTRILKAANIWRNKERKGIDYLHVASSVLAGTLGRFEDFLLKLIGTI